MKNENIISKGFYRFTQVKDFISVKNHIFTRENGKVYLALRFSNDTEYTFDSFSFDIVELNAEGKPIGKVFAEYNGISFAAGSVFAPDKAFAVSNNCVDFRIEFRKAFSGAYKYTVSRGRVSVFYSREEAEFNAENINTPNRRISNVRVRQRNEGKPFLAAVIIFVTLIIMAFCMARYLYGSFEKEQEKSGFAVWHNTYNYEEAGAIYAEI